MKTCCTCGFKLQPNENNNISFHKFPQDETLRKTWCDAIGPNFSPARTSVLCSQHFSEECFFYPPGGMNQRKHIKQGSLPTKFGFRITNSQKGKQKMRHEGFPVLLMSMMENKLHNSQAISVREFRDIPESFEITEETTSTDLIHQDVQSMFHAAVDAIDCPIAHDVELEEVTNNQDNVSAQPQTPRRKKLRRYNPRFVGDCDPNDLKSPRKAVRNWKLAMSYIKTQKRKINVIQQQNRRLRRRVVDLKSLLSELKDKNLISINAQELLSVSPPIRVGFINAGQ